MNSTNNQPPTNVKQKSTYTVKEISDILGISLRSAYNLSSETAGFKVLRIGRTVRIHRESFDRWFDDCVDGCQ